jgi:hypothetical protein
MKDYTVYLTAYKGKKFKTIVNAASITIAGEKAVLKAPKNIDWQISMIWYNA